MRFNQVDCDCMHACWIQAQTIGPDSSLSYDELPVMSADSRDLHRPTCSRSKEKTESDKSRFMRSGDVVGFAGALKKIPQVRCAT